jgi:prepilin-type N-terminal cleavage/methylation domain-containing protein
LKPGRDCREQARSLRNRAPRGFTLIELSVALAIAALLLALVVPGLGRLYARVKFNSTLERLEAGIAALPRIAFALGEEGTLADLAARHLEVPADWSLGGAEQIYVRSNGVCAGGTLRVVTPGGERALELRAPYCTIDNPHGQ